MFHSTFNFFSQIPKRAQNTPFYLDTAMLTTPTTTKDNFHLKKFYIARVFKSASKPTMFSKTDVNPFLDVSQIMPISPDSSDHKGFIVNVGNGFGIICYNWMMANRFSKEKKRYNNGFNQVECEKKYLDRVMETTSRLCDFMRNKKIIGKIGQEVIINDKHIDLVHKKIKSAEIEGLEEPKLLINKNRGLMGLFKNGPMEEAFSLDEDLLEPLGDLKNNCQVFHTSQAYTLANVHVPFDKTENAFKKILYPLIKKKMEHLSDHLTMIDFIGDKNLKPSIQRRLTQEICDQINSERIFEEREPFTVHSYVVPSRLGHQKMVNREPTLVSVDSAHRIVIHRSNEYAYHEVPYIDPSQPEPKATILCSPIL